MPPVAGAIAWARQLLRQIEQSMVLFQDTPAIPLTKEQIIRTYDKITAALVTFEARRYEKGCAQVALTRVGMTAMLLARVPDGPQLCATFDKAIFQLIREMRCRQSMGFPFPPEYGSIHAQAGRLRRPYDDLQFTLDEHRSLLAEIDPVYARLLGPRVDRLERLVRLGVVQYTWSSLNVAAYVAEVMAELASLRAVIFRANEVLHTRIEASCRAITADRGPAGADPALL